MADIIIVSIITFIAAGYLGLVIRRSLKGRPSCECEERPACPLREEVERTGKCPGKNATSKEAAGKEET